VGGAVHLADHDTDRAWPSPRRSPVSNSGTEDGSATVGNNCQSL
jgi:hypothetical protein